MKAERKPVIEMEEVSFSYDGHLVLEEVYLRVYEKDFLCIVGPNAGGKTTLLKLILGLLRPSRGSVRVFGQAPVKARARIGYMPQHASLDPLFPVSVMDVVLMGRLGNRDNFGFFGKRDRSAAREALEQVELSEVRNRSFSDLSGGQQQRVLIARALVSDPEILLLDEPTSSVDAAIETELYELLNRLNEKMTIVLVTHDLGFVSHYVKGVACVNRRVVVHPTSEITGEMINEMYGCNMHMVRHDTLKGRGEDHG
ncbi:MAG: ABC transporter ATP-binding protein [Deltaproteobacteria bacterium]|nr:ABC transporter ATP-binding protein [Deltaproteobacteria bacterium]